MEHKTTFRIHLTTKFGIGFTEKKAKSIEECFDKLCKSDKLHCTSIEDLETDETRFCEDGILLGEGILTFKD